MALPSCSRRFICLPVLLTAVTLFLTGCGGGSSNPGTPSTNVATVTTSNPPSSSTQAPPQTRIGAPTPAPDLPDLNIRSPQDGAVIATSTITVRIEGDTWQELRVDATSLDALPPGTPPVRVVAHPFLGDSFATGVPVWEGRTRLFVTGKSASGVYVTRMVQVTHPADSVEGVRIVVTPSTVSSTSTPVQISGTASGIGSPVGAYIDADGDGRLDATFAWPGPVSWTYPSQGYYSPRVVVRLANGTCHDSALDPAPVTVSAPPTLASVPGQFELPVPALDVAVERLGGLVLVLGSNGRVYVFSPAGAGAGSFPLTGVQSAAAIDCDENGDLYAVDRSQHLLLKFSRQLGYAPDSSFGIVGAVGGQGSGNGQFHAPFDVQCVLANGGTQVWVADRLNARLQSFNLLGEFQASLATGPDITLPVSLVADIGGYVTVVDGADGDLAVFETGGTRLAYRPNAISIDPNIVPRACVDFDFGALILSAGNRTMLRCERNGNTRTLIDLAPAIPVAAVNTPDGQTLVLTAGATRLSRLIQPEPIGESPVEVATRFFAAVNQGSDSIATGLVAPQAGQQLSTVLAHPVHGPAYRALAGRVASITELSRTPRLASIHAMVDPGTPGAQPITLDLQRDEATQRWLLLGL